MALLLVSVIGADEAGAAVAGGADIVDVKDPREGSLGAPRPDVLRAVRAATPRGLAVSAAIGDMPDLPGTAALAALGAVVAGADYVKVGLWGPRDPEGARTLVAAVVRAAGEARVIAAAYADGADDRLLSPESLPEIAADAGAHGCMLDTLHKPGRGLRGSLTEREIGRFVEHSRRCGLLVAVAGSLSLEDIDWLRRAVAPDIVGVRGAACRDGRRGGAVDATRVAALKAALQERMPEAP